MTFDIMNTLMGEKLKMIADGRRKWNQRFVWKEIFKDKTLHTFILDLITEDQLFKKGVDEDGNVIGEYSIRTQEISGGEKMAGTHYTLKDTGAFFDSFTLDVYPDYFEINANPIKINDEGEKTNLFFKYGEGIIGLTQESLEKLGQEIILRFEGRVRQVLLS